MGMIDLYAYVSGNSYIILELSDSRDDERKMMLELTEAEAFRVASMLEGMATMMQVKRRTDEFERFVAEAREPFSEVAS